MEPTIPPNEPVGRRLEKTAGILSIIAGLLHGIAAPAHFEAWWGYGLFFVFATTAQLLLGLALLTHAINPQDYGKGWERATRGLYLGGMIGNLLIIGLYLVTRTSGIPYGPQTGLVEGVGLLDAASKVAEAAVVAILAVLITRIPRPIDPS